MRGAGLSPSRERAPPATLRPPGRLTAGAPATPRGVGSPSGKPPVPLTRAKGDAARARLGSRQEARSMELDLIQSLAIPGTSKIVLLSADGLGGFPDPATGRSELE